MIAELSKRFDPLNGVIQFLSSIMPENIILQQMVSIKNFEKSVSEYYFEKVVQKQDDYVSLSKTQDQLKLFKGNLKAFESLTERDLELLWKCFGSKIDTLAFGDEFYQLSQDDIQRVSCLSVHSIEILFSEIVKVKDLYPGFLSLSYSHTQVLSVTRCLSSALSHASKQPMTSEALSKLTDLRLQVMQIISRLEVVRALKNEIQRINARFETVERQMAQLALKPKVEPPMQVVVKQSEPPFEQSSFLKINERKQLLALFSPL